MFFASVELASFRVVLHSQSGGLVVVQVGRRASRDVGLQDAGDLWERRLERRSGRKIPSYCYVPYNLLRQVGAKLRRKRKGKNKPAIFHTSLK